MKISKEKSNILRAMAIIFVLIGHGLQWLTNSNLSVLNWGGGVGVAIFLMLSGYGLTESYLSEGKIDSKKFWKKRICTVMIPYWIIMVIQEVLDRILFKRDIGVKETLLSLIGYNAYTRLESIDSTMWYITFLMLCYILFFVVFKLPFKNVIKGIILMSLFVLGFVMKVSLTTDWYINYFCFPLGVLISLCGGGLQKNIRKIIVAISLLLFVAISTGYYNGKMASENILFIYCLFGGIFFVFGEFYNNFLNVKLLNLIGKSSYAIYLVEGFFVNKFRIFYSIDSSWSDVLVYWILSIETGIVLHLIYKNIRVHIGENYGKIFRNRRLSR